MKTNPGWLFLLLFLLGGTALNCAIDSTGRRLQDKYYSNAPSKGIKKARVTILIFTDFQCPFCKRLSGRLDQLLTEFKGQVKLVYKAFPLSFHRQAFLAAEAAFAAHQQGKFWEMHDILLDNYNQLTRADLIRYAQKIGLNVSKFESDLDKGTFKGQVQLDIDQGKSLGVTGTPNMFFNKRLIKGALPYGMLKSAVLEELKK